MPERTIVITGASDGIGASAARTFARQGERVVVVGRSAQKTEAIANEIGADFFVSDFADLAQVRTLATQLKEKYPRIDVLANNAGGIMGPRELTVDGHEKTFQVNHLAPFLLTTELIEVLTASQATVINTSSVANSHFAKFDIDDLDAAKSYSTNRAYGNAKLANILFTAELHNRYNTEGISTAAFHPGGVATNFAADSTSPMRLAYKSFLKRFMLTPDQGADTLVWLANATPGHDWISGAYYAKRTLSKANKQAYDAGVAKALWQRSEPMVAQDLDKLDPRP